ncbi:MAG: cytochrome c biogenesis protein CcsA [Syntrophaceae bacterium]
MSATVLGISTFVYLAAFILSLAAARSEGRGLSRAVWWAALAGLVLQSVGMALRWWESYQMGVGHAPLANFYESLVFFAWAVILLSLGAARAKASPILPFVLALAAGLMGYASFAPQVESGIKPLIPALKSNWLAIHVMTCFLGYASFVLATVVGSLGLRALEKGRDAAGLEDLFARYLSIGFIIFTIGIMTGSVWAFQAWGRYWGWDPKETWALITWLIYAAVIHERRRSGGLARRAVILALIGLASVLFTYIGVNYLPGLHSYL